MLSDKTTEIIIRLLRARAVEAEGFDVALMRRILVQEIRKLTVCALFEKGEAMCLGRDESLTVVAFRVIQLEGCISVGSYQTMDICTQVVRRSFNLYGHG